MNRNEILCNTIRTIDVTTASTGAIVESCREALPDATGDEIKTALRTVADEHHREASAIERYRRYRGAGIRGVIDGKAKH